jgi:hypothetical protein
MSEHEPPAEQRQPIEDGHDDASDRDRLDGLVEQTKQDVAMGHVDDAETALRQRLADAGIDVDDEEFATLLASVRG